MKLLNNRLFREEIANGIYFNGVLNKKYKYNRLSINLFMPLEKDTCTEYALLSSVLGKSTDAYKSLREVNIKLNELYGASLSSDVVKIGDLQSVKLHMNFLPSRYCLNNESIIEECTNFLCDILFKPNVQNNRFIESEIEIEKIKLADFIESEINDKRGYAIKKCIQVMCKDDKYSIPKYGYTERIDNITSESLYKNYLDLLKKCRAEIVFVGSDDYTAIKDIMYNRFTKIERIFDTKIEIEINPKIEKVKHETEVMDIKQSKLVIGFKTGEKKSQVDNVILTLVSFIFGALPSSKLFRNVREKLGLCYYCSVRYDKYKELLFVDSGIEHENKDKALSEILKQLDLIKSGEVDESELSSAKKSFISAYNTVFDSPKTVEMFYLTNSIFDNKVEPEDLIKIAEQVSVQDIIELSKNINLDTVYFLTGKSK